MELQDIIGFAFIGLFLGAPFAAVYFCLRFFNPDSERLLVTTLFVWLEWLIGFIFAFFFAAASRRFGMPDEKVILNFITSFTVLNTVITIAILRISEQRAERISIFDNAPEEPVKKPGFIVRKAFLANVAATLTILALFGSFYFIGTMMEKYYPKKQEFTLYDS